MNKREKIEACFKDNPERTMTATCVYNALFKDDPDINRQLVSSTIHNIVKNGGCVYLHSNLRIKIIISTRNWLPKKVKPSTILTTKKINGK